jgi:hypothetical protein
MKHLLIPDSHALPGEDLRRYDWLGELILEEQPDVIIDIGDWWDMASLCSYDKGTKSFEGRRYKDDILAGHEADRRCFGAISRYNNTRARHKKRKYSPTIIRCLGNHEARINRAVESQPELDGVIGMDDLNPRLDLNYEYYDFLEPAIVDGIAYCHYFVSGVMGRPVSSTQAMITKQFMSCTMGHTHTVGTAEGVRADGQRIRGLWCGAFLDPDHVSTYANPQSQNLWWSGVHIKDDVNDGSYTRREISAQSLKERYA